LRYGTLGRSDEKASGLGVDGYGVVGHGAAFADDTLKEIDNGGVSLVATLKVKPGQADRFMEAMKKNVVESQKEPGVVVYRSYRAESNPNLFINFEAYKDKAAFQAHLNSHRVKEAVKVLDEVLSDPADLLVLAPY
jgi:quinol monooxygenase YgiN